MKLWLRFLNAVCFSCHQGLSSKCPPRPQLALVPSLILKHSEACGGPQQNKVQPGGSLEQAALVEGS